MLNRKQLEDASKCDNCKSQECSIYNGEGIYDCIQRPSQAALTLLDMLVRLEWSFLFTEKNVCPLCFMTQEEGHTHGCQLGNLLREVEV